MNRRIVILACLRRASFLRNNEIPIVTPAAIPAKAGIQEGAAGVFKWMLALEYGIKSSFPLARECIISPLDSGLRRNDEMPVVTSAVI